MKNTAFLIFARTRHLTSFTVEEPLCPSRTFTFVHRLFGRDFAQYRTLIKGRSCSSSHFSPITAGASRSHCIPGNTVEYSTARQACTVRSIHANPCDDLSSRRSELPFRYNNPLPSGAAVGDRSNVERLIRGRRHPPVRLAPHFVIIADPIVRKLSSSSENHFRRLRVTGPFQQRGITIRSSGTPALRQRIGSLIQLSGRYNCRSISMNSPAPT